MKSDRRTLLGIGLAVLLFALLAAGGNLWKSNLKVRTVDVRGTVNVEPNHILQLSAIERGSSMYDLNLTQVQRNVMSHFFIRAAVVERSLPGTVRISVVERIPIALVTGPVMMYIDEDGVLLPPAAAKVVYDLPAISGYSASATLLPGAVAQGADIEEAVMILWALRQGDRTMYHRISEVRLRDKGDIVLYSAEWGVPIIFGHGDIGPKLARLRAFWDAEVSVRGAQQLQYIDLRYADQVVARWGEAPRAS